MKRITKLRLLLPGKRTVKRLPLRAMVMDTASGRWHSYSSEPVVDRHYSAPISSDFQSARRIDEMKARAYAQLSQRMMR